MCVCVCAMTELNIHVHMSPVHYNIMWAYHKCDEIGIKPLAHIYHIL